MLTKRFSTAVALAITAHATQTRKGTQIPYIAHPLAVSALTLEFGGDEDQSIAALLHDAVEDGGAHYETIIAKQFGKRVIDIVMGCTDGVANATGAKAPWRERKEKYLAHLLSANHDVMLVSGCDKLANAQAILNDLLEIGPRVFDRFTAKQTGTMWYYRQLATIFLQRGAPMSARLDKTVSAIERLSAPE
ncbi:MAG: phosphohydrolase [Verrucomicrobiaceae bacterium]|nr:phosphohydrolase [Verrucomicrobiaceae bacterium]